MYVSICKQVQQTQNFRKPTNYIQGLSWTWWYPDNCCLNFVDSKCPCNTTLW